MLPLKLTVIVEFHIRLSTENVSSVSFAFDRGDFSALFWQGIARIFKNNLKDEYDPNGEDKMLEEVVVLVELGYFGPI